MLIMYFSVQAMRWGSDHGADAVAAYQRVSGLTTQHCGVVVDHRHCWLGASPLSKSF